MCIICTGCMACDPVKLRHGNSVDFSFRPTSGICLSFIVIVSSSSVSSQLLLLQLQGSSRLHWPSSLHHKKIVSIIRGWCLVMTVTATRSPCQGLLACTNHAAQIYKHPETSCNQDIDLLGLLTTVVLTDRVSTATPPKLVPKTLAVFPLVKAAE